MSGANGSGMPGLDALRARIDEIDESMVALFAERMDIAEDVAETKRASGRPVLDATREAAKIAQVTHLAPERFRPYVSSLYGVVMALSRMRQHVVLDESQGERLADGAVKREELPSSAHTAIQGVAGSWSHAAARAMLDDVHPEFLSSWEDVCASVESDRADFGVLPLENSTTGTVNRTWDLIAQHGLFIVSSAMQRIDQALLMNPGHDVSELSEVFSHEQALRQCERYLESLGPNVRPTICENTAVAARRVAESGRGDIAAIASELCADTYGLDVVARRIQDSKDNYTRFACIARECIVTRRADRSSFVVVVSHEPGSLFRLLGLFAALGVNLVKLESRPIPGSAFEFGFMLEIESVPGDSTFDAIAAQLPAYCESSRYLGSYQTHGTEVGR